jgi:hypothetical protein
MEKDGWVAKAMFNAMLRLVTEWIFEASEGKIRCQSPKVGGV